MFQHEAFFDPATFTLTFLVFDPATRDAVVIDPVLDYDQLASQTSTASADKVIAFAEARGLNLRWVLETHAHADHLSASQYLKRRLGAQVAIGERIREVQATFKAVLDMPGSFATDGSQFDRLLRDKETLEAGSLKIEVIATPGHTPACVTFKIDDAVFTGDALFMEDYGTGRCDFPRGSADELYTSVHDRLYQLPDATRVFVGHDYQPEGRPLKYETTIGASKHKNIQLKHETSREQFVAVRSARDASLRQPRLLFPSVQVNIDAGRLPPARGNGIRYLQIPVNLRRPTGDDGSSLPGTPMILRQLFDAESSTYTYLVADPQTRQAALIDPVLEQLERDLKLVDELGLRLAYVLETHVHADHVTAAGRLRERTGARTAASAAGAPCIDEGLRHGDVVRLGEVTLTALATPGHTDDGLCFLAGGHVFTGDTLLIRGCGRSDFQNGDPGQLFDSITRTLFALPDETVVLPAHDYRGMTSSTIGEERRNNPRLAGKGREQFIALMNSLDLPPPKKLALSVPANRACGLPGSHA